jgi:hypothetical protein
MGCFGFIVGILLNYIDYYKLNSVLNRGLRTSPDGVTYKERLLSSDELYIDERGSWRSVDEADEADNVLHKRGGSFSQYGEILKK